MGYQRRVHGEFTAVLTTDNMLVFLSLLSTALAAPQFYQSPYYGYPMVHGYPGLYQPVYPRVVAQYPGMVQNPVNTRGLVKFENLLEINGEFKTDSTTTPARTIAGTYTFQQNFLSDLTYGNNAYFKVYINGASGDLTGKNRMLSFGADCTTAGTDFSSINGPVTIGQGFYVTGGATGYNIDGSNSKTTMKNLYLQVRDSTGIIGCSSAALA